MTNDRILEQPSFFSTSLRADPFDHCGGDFPEDTHGRQTGQEESESKGTDPIPIDEALDRSTMQESRM